MARHVWRKAARKRGLAIRVVASSPHAPKPSYFPRWTLALCLFLDRSRIYRRAVGGKRTLCRGRRLQGCWMV